MIHKPNIQKILFATDLSENAEYAFGYAVSLAEVYGAGMTILYVMEKLAPNAELLLATYLGYSSTEELRRNSEIDLIVKIETYIEQFCADAAKQVSACRFKLNEVIVEPGKPGERILHHAGTGAYDAIVMGSRGHGLIKEALMGGTSRKVVLSSPIPVFVVPMHPGT